MILSFINIRKIPREMLKTSGFALGLQPSLGTLRMLMNGKSYLIPILFIDNKPIEKVSKQKLLGVFVDENRIWTAHIDYLCALLSTKISLLKQLAAYVPKDIQKT